MQIKVTSFERGEQECISLAASQRSRVVIQYSPVSALQGFYRGLLCFTECISSMEQVVHHKVC